MITMRTATLAGAAEGLEFLIWTRSPVAPLTALVAAHRRRHLHTRLEPGCQDAVVPPSSCAFVRSSRWCSSTSSTPALPPGDALSSSANHTTHLQEVSLSVIEGLPHLTVPLPSRRELCRFPLRPVTHTVQDLISQLQLEDKGIDRVVVATKDGIRIASSATIESLLIEDFVLRINDVTFPVTVPPNQRVTMEEVTDISDVRQLVNKLYMALNIDQHQVNKEREILAKIEEVKSQLSPLEKKRSQLMKSAEHRTVTLAWVGLGYMAVQFGFLARLTWWEYSWDIMEPFTYFVTYGTAIAAYMYYVVTRQDFILPDVRDRQFLISFYKRANKVGLDVAHYNYLRNELSQLEGDLRRLRDPLALNLPVTRLEDDPTSHDVFTKAQLTIKSFTRKNLLGKDK